MVSGATRPFRARSCTWGRSWHVSLGLSRRSARSTFRIKARFRLTICRLSPIALRFFDMNNRLTSRTERLAEIERMLFRSAHGMRVMEIAEACGVDRRTVYRDMDTLSAIGVPIWQDDGRFGIDRDQYLAT